MLNRRPITACARFFANLGLIGLLTQAAMAAELYSETPGTEGEGKITIGPEYKIDPDLTDRGNPKGKYFEFTMRLADSKIFRGDDSTLEPEKKAVRKERQIFVYVPAAYQDGTKAPILVIHDEVLPAVLNNAEIKAAYPKFALTDNPWGRAVMGCSSGGAAALTMGWFRPDLFRRLIAYSGTFVDQQDDDAAEEAKYPLGAWEYHSSMKLIENSEKKPLRIFTQVSENDLRPKDPEETHHNWVMAGERTAAALKARGYNHRFVFTLATGHCDRRVFEQTLADTLVWIWRGYHAD